LLDVEKSPNVPGAEFRTYNFVEVLGIILKVLRLEIFTYNIYSTNQFAQGGRGK
jgi:hypothetical protein